MSMFGKPAGAGVSVFTNPSQAASNPFGASTTNAQQQQQQQQPTQSLGLWGSNTANTNNQQQRQPTQSLGPWGTNTNTNNQQQQQQQQQPQAAPLGQSFFGPQQSNPAASLGFQPGATTYNDQIIPQRISNLAQKWNPTSPESAFKHYFYNKVPEEQVPFYGPGPNENPKEWDEALQNKPGRGMIPSLASGFEALANRLKTQRAVIAIFNQKLHEINNCLDAILSKHDLDWSVKMIESRRKHDALRRRTLVLARKAQVLRNRGYALSADEDELQIKLENMERTVQDPAVNARLDELWSRLIFLREQAQVLKEEVAKKGLGEEQAMDSDVEVKVKKIVEDYDKQLQHLKKECDLIKKDYTDWVKDHPNFKEEV